jgi:hypothetical protein
MALYEKGAQCGKTNGHRASAGSAGGGSDGSFTGAMDPTLDSLGVRGADALR